MNHITQHRASRLGPNQALIWGIICAISSLFVVSCSDASSEQRRASLQRLIISDNRALLDREPELVRQKFLKMARSPYEFLRGTASVFVWDSTQPGAWPSNYSTERSSLVLVLGDAHPENIGTYKAQSGVLFLDYNDFDGATFGPYHIELRRLAFAFALMKLEHLQRYEPELSLSVQLRELPPVVEQVVRGYTGEIARLAAGDAPMAVRSGEGFGGIIEDLFSQARDEGGARDELEDFTELSAGRRYLRQGVLRLAEGEIASRELQLVSEREWNGVARGVAQAWPSSVYSEGALAFQDYYVSGVRRRIGMGVSSFPVLRYYVLLQNRSEDPDDVVLLDIKEARDGVRFEGQLRNSGRRFEQNAERSVELQRAFQEFPDADPLLGYFQLGSLGFRVQQVTKWQQGADIKRISSRIQAGSWSWQDFERFAEVAGGLLARGHALSPHFGEPFGLSAVAAAISGDREGLSRETSRFVEEYMINFLGDYMLFRGLLEEEGPLLGFKSSDRVGHHEPQINPCAASLARGGLSELVRFGRALRLLTLARAG